MTAAAQVLNPASDPEERRKGIGGSDVAVILGLSPYKTPLDLWMQKRGLWEDQSESEAAYWGTVMEPVLVREYAQRHRCAVIRSDPFDGYRVEGLEALHPASDPHPASGLLGTLVHPRYPWARGHVDGIGLSEMAAPTHVVECKTASEYLKGRWGEEDTDQVPEYYLVQIQWYLMLADLEVAHLAALIGGNKFRRYIIPRDQALIDILLAEAAAFWDRVEREDPPAPEPGGRGKESLSRLYPTGDKAVELDATPALVELALRLHRARLAESVAKEAKTTLENEIKLLMADAGRLNLPDGDSITWTNNKDSRVTDWQALARYLIGERGLAADAVESLLQQFTTPKAGARVFRCNFKHMEG